MELFSPEFFSALLAIVVIDLVLAGDNAIVIALAARSLPPHQRAKAIVWGSVGAVVVRSVMTVAVVWLLKIPGLLAVGGIALLWIAYKLLNQKEGSAEHVGPASTFFGAMRTIVIADAVMGVDNVLAVAGAAHGNYLLVVLGLLISIPIVVWGSTMLLKLTQRFPIIIYMGAGVLTITGVKMALGEPMIKDWLADDKLLVQILAYATALIVVLFSGYLGQQMARIRQAAKTHAKVRLEFRRSQSKGADTMEKVLLPVDGSPNAMAAVKQVIADSRRKGQREVVLLNVQPPLPQRVARFVSYRHRQNYRNECAAKAFAAPTDALRAAGIPFVVRTEMGDRAQVISQLARELGCHVIVLGTARKNTLTRLVQSSLTTRLLETAPVPVQVVMGAPASTIERFGIPTGVGAALTALVLAID